MGLRTRLSILITTLFLLVCGVAGAYIVGNARRAVAEEMQSTAALTMDLLEAELVRGGAAGDSLRTRQFLDRLAGMDSTRNISIVIRTRDGSAPVAGMPTRPARAVAAPTWFARLVTPDQVTARRMVSEPGMPELVMELRSHAADEIAEAWRETRSVLVLMIVFTAMVMGLIYYRLGRDLSPINSILRGLEGIERGEYELRLPGFAALELSRISDKFNHMAQVLMESRAENRRLSQRSLDIQEQERRHIARELHDELGQSLTAIKAMAVATAAAPDDTERTRRSMEDVARIADHTYGVARQLMQRLRPPVLDVLGLGAALQDLVDRWNSSNGGQFCRLETSGDLQLLSDAVRITLYRIVQEALTNVARHSRAEQVHVNVCASSAGAAELRISDDGLGFEKQRSHPGLGLVGMRERTLAHDGSFTLETAPGAGVRISIRLPPAAIGES